MDKAYIIKVATNSGYRNVYAVCETKDRAEQEIKALNETYKNDGHTYWLMVTNILK